MRYCSGWYGSRGAWEGWFSCTPEHVKVDGDAAAYVLIKSWCGARSVFPGPMVGGPPDGVDCTNWFHPVLDHGQLGFVGLACISRPASCLGYVSRVVS
jgi:hypothetical protein